jgi:multiple sugar transport system ATP-binding protein
MNIVDVRLTEGGACIGEYTVPIPREARSELADQGVARHAGVPAGVGRGRRRGRRVPVRGDGGRGADAYAYAYGALHLGPESDVPDDKMFIARVDARRPPAKGETIHLRIRELEEHVFNPDTGRRVGGAAEAHTSI